MMMLQQTGKTTTKSCGCGSYIYIYIHTCIHTYIYIHAYIHTCIMCVCIYIYIMYIIYIYISLSLSLSPSLSLSVNRYVCALRACLSFVLSWLCHQYLVTFPYRFMFALPVSGPKNLEKSPALRLLAVSGVYFRLRSKVSLLCSSAARVCTS